MKQLPIALTAVGVLALSGCSASSTGSAGSGSKDPIVVGSINGLSGPATFPEASQAAKAVFDEVNAAGGIQGRKIKYEITDDKADPATASANARQLVGSDGAVGLVGSASFLECQVNAGYFEQNDVLSIEGTGVDPKCFSSPNISPVNVGPYLDAQMALTYGSEVLKKKKICVLLENQGSSNPFFKAAINDWTKATGEKPYQMFEGLPFGGADYTPYITNAKRSGCDTVFVNNVQPDALAQVKAAHAQGWDDVTFLFLTSVYTDQFAKAAGGRRRGLRTCGIRAARRPECPRDEGLARADDEEGHPTHFLRPGRLPRGHVLRHCAEEHQGRDQPRVGHEGAARHGTPVESYDGYSLGLRYCAVAQFEPSRLPGGPVARQEGLAGDRRQADRAQVGTRCSREPSPVLPPAGSMPSSRSAWYSCPGSLAS